MRGLIEAGVFLSLATGLHLVLWVGPDKGALKGSGSDGENLLSLQASSAGVAEMVAAWEQPLALQTDLAAPSAPEAPAVDPAHQMERPEAPDQPMRSAALQPDMAVPPRAPDPVAPPPSAPDRRAPDKPRPLPPDVQVDLAAAPAFETASHETPLGLALPSLPDRPMRSVATAPTAEAPSNAPEPGSVRTPAAARLAPAKPPPAPSEMNADAFAPPRVRPRPRPTDLSPPPLREAQPQPDSPPPQTRPRPRPKDLARAAPAAPPPQAADTRPPTTSTKSSAAAVAAGSGGQAAQGGRQQAKTATLSDGQRASLLQRWGSKVRARVARRAPRGLGKGTAVVIVTLTGSGGVVGVSLQASSGNPDLDQHAVAAVRNAGPFPAAPPDLAISSHSFALPIASR